MGDTDVNETVDTPRDLPPVLARRWTSVPFLVLGACWLGYVAALTYLLMKTSPGRPVASPYYPYFVFGGATLTLLGFVTGFIVWLVASRRAAQDDGTAVSRTVWFRALGTNAAGVFVWLVGLLLLDLQRVL